MNKQTFLRNGISNYKNIIPIIVAFLVLAIFYFLPTPEGLTHNGQVMIGILIMAAILWITEPIPLAVTGLLIMIIQPLLQLITPDEVFSSFGNQAVFFLIVHLKLVPVLMYLV